VSAFPTHVPNHDPAKTGMGRGPPGLKIMGGATPLRRASARHDDCNARCAPGTMSSSQRRSLALAGAHMSSGY
jgi:hypothetical protein